MSESVIVLLPDPMEKLRREQPRLYRDLCEGISRLHTVKFAIHRLREPYVIDGAVADVLALINEAAQQVDCLPTR